MPKKRIRHQQPFRGYTMSGTQAKGWKSKLPVTRYVHLLFETNEQQGMHHTNYELEMLLRREFNHVDKFVKSLDKKHTSVNWWRLKYNTGKLFKGQPPVTLISLRYDHERKPVDYRTGKRVLTHGEIKEICDKYGIEDERYSEAQIQRFTEGGSYSRWHSL